MRRPRLLDCYSGAGGSAAGYHRAGFDVVGVDHIQQPHYPFAFIQADALEYVATHGHEYDAIHASPPCQRYSMGTPNRAAHPDLLPPTRAALVAVGKPWVIENVPGAPMRADYRVCGCMVGLPRIRRMRWFETSWHGFAIQPACQHDGPVVTVTGHGTTSRNRASLGRNVGIAEMREVMGIDWMNRDELSQAIPPAYTEWLGSRLMQALEWQERAS